MIELCKPYHMQLLTNFTRQILNKRMPKLNGYQGEEKGLQSTMTRYLEGVDSNMKKFDSIEIAISFPVRRIARLNELTTIDIVKEYGIALSRIGHPFDFSGEISAFE